MARAKISVIIPTYNRSALLRATLDGLTRQNLPPGDFQVVVADDGSADDSRAVAESFAGLLDLSYFFQEDLGFRAAAARNAGARLSTAPILLFLDSGCVPGPDFVRGHLAAQEASGGGCAALGTIYGYNPDVPMPELPQLMAELSLDELVAGYRDDPRFADLRSADHGGRGFDPAGMRVPWGYFFTGNVSVPAEAFDAVGGFDETFRTWGCEDLELGLRLWRRGLPYRAAPDAWVVESPHERDVDTEWPAFLQNFLHLLDRNPEPAVEIGWANFDHGLIEAWDADCAALDEHRSRVRDLDAEGEIAAFAAGRPAGERIAVMGCGPRIPRSLTAGDSVLIDFDLDALGPAEKSGHPDIRHALGVRTGLADGAVDAVLVTSRLAGIWARWGADILAEARRIGRAVHVAFDHEETATSATAATTPPVASH